MLAYVEGERNAIISPYLWFLDLLLDLTGAFVTPYGGHCNQMETISILSLDFFQLINTFLVENPSILIWLPSYNMFWCVKRNLELHFSFFLPEPSVPVSGACYCGKRMDSG